MLFLETFWVTLTTIVVGPMHLPIAIARLSLALLLAGCTEEIQLAPLGSVPPPASGPGRQVCDTPGCDDALARLFRYALCSCDDVTFGAPFETIGSASGASIGTNGRYVVLAPLDIAGSWISSGAASSTLANGAVHVAGNLKSAGELKVVGAQLTVDRDLWAQNAFTTAAGGSLRVRGVTYQPPVQVSAGDFKLDGGVRSQSFVVTEPCACSADNVDFDRVASGIADAPLVSARSELSRELACGRYRLEPGRIAGARFHVAGHVTLFVDGDLELADRFEPELEANASLDIYVRGALTLAPGVNVGAIAHAAGLRFFAGGASRLLFPGGATFAAQVYSPLAEVRAVTDQTFHGSLHVGSYIALGNSAIYATAQTCSQGTTCTQDADCEDPSLCTSGQCEAQ